MKTKITKDRPAALLAERLKGVAHWRVTGRDPSTGSRLNVVIKGTREDAERFAVDKGLKAVRR